VGAEAVSYQLGQRGTGQKQRASTRAAMSKSCSSGMWTTRT
jgi:hypothetical protein